MMLMHCGAIMQPCPVDIVVLIDSLPLVDSDTLNLYIEIGQNRHGTLIREGGGAVTTLPTVQLDLAEKGIVGGNRDFCPALQTHVNLMSLLCAAAAWWGGTGGCYGERLPGKVKVDAKCLLDCNKTGSAPRIHRVEGTEGLVPTLNPLPKASSSSIPAHTDRNFGGLPPTWQIGDVKSARR